ncbi:DUF4910 domain-containing protein [Alphaproteobacteria bacterium]|nr:DUF4910 domain-containing protein [Alphaproteobacteria bacterium]
MNQFLIDDGGLMLDLMARLFPLNRSLTGEGNRKTLNILREYLPNLRINEVPTGTECFDWCVPEEWHVNEAYIIDPKGQKICDFNLNNLFLVGYSISFSGRMTLEELKPHLHSRPDLPNVVPYCTSYYDRTWGFCISDNQLNSLVDGVYTVHIDTEIFAGSMSYGEVVVEGDHEKEIFLSTYICHPSMANNELSGPVVTTALIEYFNALVNKPKYTIRAVFVPETIGSIYYISKNLKHLKETMMAGFNLSCVGDDRAYSMLPTKYGNMLVDRVARHIIKNICPNSHIYSWLERGSDERQYCSPGVDLPVLSLMRSKHTEYDEYHTSADLIGDVVTKAGLEGGARINKLAIEALMKNFRPKARYLCEPMMRKYDLYPAMTEGKRRPESTRLYMNILTWADGSNDLIDIAEYMSVPVWELYEPLKILKKAGVIL